MAEPQYVVIAGFPNADFMAVALDKDGAAISEKTFKPVDFMREMESFLEAYPAPEIRMIGPKDYAVEYKRRCSSRVNMLPHPVFDRGSVAADTRKKIGGIQAALFYAYVPFSWICPVAIAKTSCVFREFCSVAPNRPLTPLGIPCVLRGMFCCVSSSIMKTKNSVSLQLFCD